MAGPNDPDEDQIDEVEDEGQENEPGLIDDEGGDEAEARQEPEDVEGEEGQVEARPSRGTRAVQEAKRIAREAAAEAAALKKELAEIRAERQRNETKGETPEQETARLALMTVEERVDYKLAKAKTENERAMGLVRFQAADSADKAAYASRASVDPRYKRYEADVERLLMEERRQGRDFPRETILRFVLGDRVMQNKGKIDQQRKQGQQNINRQRTQPDTSRSDRSAQRRGGSSGNTLADLEKRLEGVEI